MPSLAAVALLAALTGFTAPASGQQVVFDNMPGDAWDTGFGQCLHDQMNLSCNPLQRTRYANGFEPGDSGPLWDIEFPIDHCASPYCGQCGACADDAEIVLRVSLHRDAGGVPGPELAAWTWTEECFYDEIVHIDAAASGVSLLQHERYWLAVEAVDDQSASILWNGPLPGTPDAFSGLVAVDDCQWDAGCLAGGTCVRSALRVRIGPDTDGDGIADAWETGGIDADSDGTVDLDLAALGADPNLPDVFVEVDAMDGYGPAQSTMDAVAQAFADAPVDVAIHVLRDELNAPVQNWPDVWSSFDAFKTARFGTPAERASGNWPAIRTAKRLVYRYCVFARQYGNSDSSGIAEIQGNDLVVTLGHPAWDDHDDEDCRARWQMQAGTFMHELGHTLGLRHGGGNDVNYKPNYYSVMNYAWQMPACWNASGSWPLDYSRFAMLDLVESSLDECDGMGDLTGSGYDGYSSPYNRRPPGQSPATAYAPLDDDEVDWNANGTVTCAPPSHNLDLNRILLSDGTSSPGQTLHGFDDWSGLDFNFRDDPDYADGAHGSADGLVEITASIAGELAGLTPPECPAGLFGGDPVVFYAGFESGSLGGWDFSGSTDGEPCGAIAIGQWCADLETPPLDCDHSARLFAQATSSAPPWQVKSVMTRTVGPSARLSARLRFDQIQGNDGVGHSFFQIAVLDAADESRSYRYGFSASGGSGGDTTIQVAPGQVLDFSADFASDFEDKNGYAIPGDVVVRVMANCDYAESAPPGQQVRTAEVALDNVVIRPPVPCPADVNDDGLVDVDDLVDLILAWGTSDPAADVNGDGTVDVDDLTEVVLSWGEC